VNLADKQEKSKVKGPDLKIRGQRELSAKLLDCKAVFREKFWIWLHNRMESFINRRHISL
jgi:hypothetical protein